MSFLSSSRETKKGRVGIFDSWKNPLGPWMAPLASWRNPVRLKLIISDFDCGDDGGVN